MKWRPTWTRTSDQSIGTFVEEWVNSALKLDGSVSQTSSRAVFAKKNSPASTNTPWGRPAGPSILSTLYIFQNAF